MECYGHIRDVSSMERRKSFDAGSKSVSDAAKRRSVFAGQEEKGSASKLEQIKLENLKETVKNHEEKDPQLAAKLGRLSDNIDAVIDKTRSAREELERMTEITRELKAQTEIQQMECQNLESDQRQIREDIENVTKRMEILLAEKKRVEERLATMKDQNNKLQEFLEV